MTLPNARERIDTGSVPTSVVHIRAATPDDLPGILRLFDGAVVWLVERGLGAQWGTEPFTGNEAIVRRFTGWIERGELVVAEFDGRIAGAVALCASPPAYAREVVKRRSGPSLYLEALCTDRAIAGQGFGAALLAYAERTAQVRGIRWMLLDCWAGNDHLMRYYERAGFTRLEQVVEKSWTCQLFERRVLDLPGT